MTLNENLNKIFVKERHGVITRAILKDVRKNKVVLSCPDRQDAYTISISEFTKHYRLAATA